MNSTATIYKAQSGKKNVITMSDDLHFTIRFFTSYQAYDWSRFYTSDDYGEIGSGLVRGDRYSFTEPQHGFIYIFKKVNAKITLHTSYILENGLYTPISVTESDLSHSKAGTGKKYMIITDYFELIEKSPSASFYTVISKIKLSKERLFADPQKALIKDPTRRGFPMTLYRWKLLGEQENRSGGQIFDDFNSYSKKKPVTLDTYNYIRDEIDGLVGFHFLVPDIAEESVRRNKLFNSRVAKYLAWQNEETRTQEAFLIQSITSILRQSPGRKKYINGEAFEKCRKKHSDNYRKYFFPVHYATEDLIAWLDEPLFNEFLLDYELGSDPDRIEGVHIYHNTIRDLKHIEKGAQYLGKVYDDSQGFLNRNFGFIELKKSYSDSGLNSNLYTWIRKWDNVIFDFLEEIIPVLAAKEKSQAITIVANIVRVHTGKVLDIVKVKPVSWSSKVVEVADVQVFLLKIQDIGNTTVGKSIISFIELGNVAFAIVGVCAADKNEDIAKNVVNLIGAVVDLSTNCWLTKTILERKYYLKPLQFISGLIDCIVGIWQAKDEWKSGDLDTSLGWATFALGGAIIAVGFAIRMIGIKTVVVSGGTAAKPGAIVIAAGLLVEGIGLALVFFCNNDEIEDWLTQSTFGTKPMKTTQQQQIQNLNDIMCKFEVKARFEDIPEKFNNRTYVTLIIKPRAISDNSKITFSNMKALAYGRISEYIFGNRHDLTTGMAGSANPVLDLANPVNCKILREKDRIAQIETTLSYGMDIDEVTGTAKLEFGNGALQGYTKNFVVKA